MKNLQTLLYHRVCADDEWYPSEYVVTKRVFRRHLQYLVRHGYYTPPIEDVLKGTLNSTTGERSPVLITFDDGYLDNYQHAFPLLQEFGLTAVIFLVADFSRRTNWWDAQAGIPQTRLMEKQHLLDMDRAGIQFGSHTLTHPRLAEIRLRDARRELAESKTAIEQMIGRRVDTFSYPYSSFHDGVKQAVRDAGYAFAFAVNDGPRHLPDDLFAIRRMNVTNHPSGFHLFTKLNGTEKTMLWCWSEMKVLLRYASRGLYPKGYNITE